MSSVGAYLRGLRQGQGMSIDELSRATRVLHHYLEALETDNIRALPAPVFTKGFIRAYCQAVGVPPDEALKIYDRIGVPVPDVGKVPAGAPRVSAVAEVARRPIVQEPDYLPVTPPGVPLQGQARQGRARGTLLVSFILVVVLGAAFFAVTFTLQTGQDAGSAPSTRAPLPPAPVAAEAPPASPEPVAAHVETAPPPPVATQLVKQSPPSPSAPAVSAPPAPSAPSASAPSSGAPSAPPNTAAGPAPKVAAAPPAAAVSATLPAPAAPTPAASTSAAVAAARGLAAPYRLIARTTETTWMRVRTGDGPTSEETIPANEIREWISNSPFIITIGNAGGVSLELNGRVLPRLGASGSVVTRLVLPSDTQ